ncbi:MAG: hypothetical protein IKR57_04820 [Bacilli bacterium]|nr:hypothetical protein [Bacilli bacterium]
MLEDLEFFKKEKKEKDVYDIINGRIKKYNKDIYLALPKFISIIVRVNKLKKNGKSIESIEADLFNVIQCMLPAFIDSAHYSYEIYNDIDNNYGYEKLLEYVQSNGKNPLEFAYNYNKTKNTMLKLLTLFAIVKKEGITVNDFNSADVAAKIMSGEKLEEIIADKFMDMSYESEEVIEKLVDKEVAYSDLSPEVHNMVKEYHMNYMNENVYPYLNESNSRVNGEERVLKLASKLGKSKRSIL